MPTRKEIESAVREEWDENYPKYYGTLSEMTPFTVAVFKRLNLLESPEEEEVK